MIDEPDANLQTTSWRRLFFRIATYLGTYLIGILTCIAFTPVEMVLAGKMLVGVYIWFSLPGFVFFFLGYGTDIALLWYVGLACLAAMALGLTTFFRNWPRLAVLRPWLLAFPVGFVGSVGAFYSIAASI